MSCFTLLTEATGDGDSGDAQAAMQEALLQTRHFLQYESEVERLMFWHQGEVRGGSAVLEDLARRTGRFQGGLWRTCLAAWAPQSLVALM